MSIKHWVRKAFSSKDKLKKFVQTKEQGDTFNEDLLPSPPSHRTWTALHFFAYYLTQTFSPSSYNLGATLVSIGLTWWHGLIAAVIGSSILSCIVILNSRGATRYHVGFPVYVRAAAGVAGSKLFIVVRASVAIIYFATQSYYGGRITSVGLRAIFGSSWEKIPNTLPASAGITSANLLGFFIFWIIQFPFMFIHPVVVRHLFVLKSVVTTAAFLGVFGWAVSANGGSIGNFSFGTETLSGSALVWPMIQAINSVMAALCPILINQPDIARYATRPSQATWSQSTGILISKDLYDAVLTEFSGSAARAGIFFACLSMVIAVIANIGSNSLPVGADISGLLPKYINIVRGQIFCAIMAPLCVPWKIIANATTFLTFLGSYTVMVVDYWVIRRGNLHVTSLYTKAGGAPYTYYHGWNPRAVAAWVSGVAFTVHGISGSLNPGSVNDDSLKIYKLGLLLSFLMGCSVYYVLSLIWPPRVYPSAEPQGSLAFEYMARSEGFFPGESVDSMRGVLSGVAQGEEWTGQAPFDQDEKTLARISSQHTYEV
ncbi:putative allantoin permease [Hypoxylon sp. FL1150]|nr:putative allantoin permease [Hypoxylon sp. FL1150]